MIDVRSGYALVKVIDGNYYIMTRKRDNSTIVVFSAELEPIMSAKTEIEAELGTGLGLEIARIVDCDMFILKDPKPLKIGWRAKGFRIDRPQA